MSTFDVQRQFLYQSYIILRFVVTVVSNKIFLIYYDVLVGRFLTSWIKSVQVTFNYFRGWWAELVEAI